VRRRIFADAPDREEEVQQLGQQQLLLAQQLAEAQTALKLCQQRMAEQHAAALAEQAAEAEEQAKAVGRARNRMEELVHLLQSTHQDHVSRVCQPGVADLTGDALRELAQLRSTLPSYADAPFHDVPDSMVDQWTTDIEELETALAGPLLPSPVTVDATAAQVVCTRLNEIWQQLQDAPASGLPLMQMLLLSKKLRCVDQLRPNVDEASVTPYQCFELRALLMRLCAHDDVWSFTLRFPCSYFETAPSKMKDRAANFYVKASRAARPDVRQQARLLVEQCKVLEGADQLSKAKGLDSVVLEYPEAPLGLLHQLHSQYPAAGPSMDRARMAQWDAEWSQWQAACAQAELHASELERQAKEEGATVDQQEQAEQALSAVGALTSSPPRDFTLAMRRSCTFFHSDKRLHEQGTSATEQAAQFAQAKEAWDELNACRTHFQELREFQQKCAASK
jgi:hypothetical protein